MDGLDAVLAGLQLVGSGLHTYDGLNSVAVASWQVVPEQQLSLLPKPAGWQALHNCVQVALVFVPLTVQAALQLMPLLHLMFIKPRTPLLLLLKHADCVSCVHAPGLPMLQHAPRGSWSARQKPHVLARFHLPPCPEHCVAVTSVRHFLLAQQAPRALEQVPLLQLLLGLKLPVHLSAVVTVHTTLLQQAAWIVATGLTTLFDVFVPLFVVTTTTSARSSALSGLTRIPNV